METLRTGDLAYYNSFSGLIPCKVTKITGPFGFAGSEQNVTFTLTANRGPYRRGESLTQWALHVVPRKSVRVTGGQYRIRCYQVVA